MAIPKVDLTVDPDWTNLVLGVDSSGRKIATCPGCARWIVIDNYIGSRQVFQAQLPHKPDCVTMQTFLAEVMQRARKVVPENWTNIEELFAAVK